MPWKVISPKKLKIKAFSKASIDALKGVGVNFKQDFDATSKTWKHQPVFGTTFAQTATSASVTVATKDEIYRYVNDGTKAHIIRPKGGGVLSFQGGFTAKTSPGVIGSGAGGSSGAMVHTRVVHHPGTKARKFDEAILRKWQGKLAKELGIIMRVFREESGHAI